MYSSRRSGQVTPLHNTHTIPTTLTGTTRSALWSHYSRHSNRHTTRSKANLKGTYPFHCASSNKACLKISLIYQRERKP